MVQTYEDVDDLGCERTPPVMAETQPVLRRTLYMSPQFQAQFHHTRNTLVYQFTCRSIHKGHDKWPGPLSGTCR
jgi:hypothetical protein